MLVSIGQAPKTHSDVTDALLDCHERIRRFTALAVTLGSRPDLPVAETVYGVERVTRYFRLALPQHVRDEEESVLPRLKGRARLLDEALATMHAEHEAHVSALERLFTRLEDVRGAPLDTGARTALLDAATSLSAAFEEHLRAEEAIILPALRQYVPSEVRAAMLGELRARRA
ncbi:MAG: hemerythrin domain-containing protein [Archangiaceae bacterium]|nr:hemerythrin domain-containing protein [Archangiaceae bacterium]